MNFVIDTGIEKLNKLFWAPWTLEITMKNVGKADQIIRILAGLILLSLVFIGPETLWGLIGLVPLVTGLSGFCPAYKLLGMNTCPVSDK